MRKSLDGSFVHGPAAITACGPAVINEDLTTTRRQRDQSSSLSAVSINVDILDAQQSSAGDWNTQASSVDWNSLATVLTTALMVTGNTIGAGCLVLPEVAAQPGLGVTACLFGASYVVNLISGVLLAEVAIKQHESSGDHVPSSFKDFADENLDSSSAGTIVSSISMFNNACVLAFGLSRAGDVISSVLGSSPTLGMVGFAAALAALRATQSGESMSKIASVTVMVLFTSFFGLLVPGLANVHDPVGTFLTPGTADGLVAGISQALPIILTTTVYQNIVPSVVKILDYDRTKSVAAISLGSFLPLCLYLAWCFASIGGGADASGALLTVFSIAAVIGSCAGCLMSLSEEVDSFLPATAKSGDGDEENVNPMAVIAAVAVPLMAAIAFAGGEDLTVTLKIAGSYGTPLLYGAIPAMMAWTQREKLGYLPNLVPGGVGTLGALGMASAGLLIQELSIDVGHLFPL